MASLNRPTKSDYIIHDCVTVDTPDNEDHTFRFVVYFYIIVLILFKSFYQSTSSLSINVILFIYIHNNMYSGIMFPIQCKDVLPVNHIVIFGLQVRYVSVMNQALLHSLFHRYIS